MRFPGGKPVLAAVIAAAMLAAGTRAGSETERPLVLQEMTWQDVREYLKTRDMIIIPLGSTEQQGPHLPLGTDLYEAYGISKIISAKSGVIVAPLALAGYSDIHAGFPGTVSVRPETLEKYLFECAESLIAQGFKKIMFFNYHGGNNIIQSKVMHRINHETPATALAIGIGGPIRKDVPAGTYEKFFDWHAGLGETSIMMYLEPSLVRRDRIENPALNFRFTREPGKLRELFEKNPELAHVWSEEIGVPARTGKGGASHEFTSNGVWTLNDLKTANPGLGKMRVDAMVKSAVDFIEAWKKVK
jgi:creatinine amidohydrolase/Fe(II)-dependent formamide hydrolase-like protein